MARCLLERGELPLLYRLLPLLMMGAVSVSRLEGWTAQMIEADENREYLTKEL